MAGGKSIYDVLGDIADFDELLSAETLKESKKLRIKRHLEYMIKTGYKVPDFEKESDWLNVQAPLSIHGSLQGHILILDFFTYCCINCMHILPDLEEVEEKFPLDSGVVILGVHSAKFLNEKSTANIRSAVLRYGINHPVVNDSDATLWNKLAVSCWPTLLFVGPKGDILYSIAGEGHKNRMIEFLEVAIEFFENDIKPCTIPMSLEIDKRHRSELSFPGKICMWEKKRLLIISDTGNHRILVTDLNGTVQAVIGNGKRGLKDGSWSEAQFSSPQGVAGIEESIYVADTDNHCLREINWEKRMVSTIAGTGHQGTDTEGGKLGTCQELSSPWDVVDGGPNSSVLYVAMSGTHQIWIYFLSDSQSVMKRSYPKTSCIRFAGSGKEENRNNSYPEKASFAQPSGLVISASETYNSLYVADSESSTVRKVSLPDGKVTGVVGGEKDPSNLFSYGDTAGKGTIAKLQHPLGVALLTPEGPLLIADSYNHKIKTVDLSTSHCETLTGTGRVGNSVSQTSLLEAEFNEPGGLDVDKNSQLVYVADTNNHVIKVLDIKQQRVYQLPIVFSDDAVDSPFVIERPNDYIELPAVPCSVSSKSIDLCIPVTLSVGEHINPEAPQSWKLSALDNDGRALLECLNPMDLKGKPQFSSGPDASVPRASLTLPLPPSLQPGAVTIVVALQVFVCAGEVCLPPRTFHFAQQIDFAPEA